MIALSNRLIIAVLILLACLAISAQAVSADNTVTLTGKVTMPNGQPAAGAKVIALKTWIVPAYGAETTTSQDGSYTLNVAPNTYKIVARHGALTGFTWFTLQADGTTTRTSDINLTKGCMLMGMLTDKTTGQLLPDATVVLDRLETFHTGPDGTFSALVPADLPVEIRVTRDGYARCWTRFEPNGQSVAAIQFETKPEGILIGTVTDEQGNPIPRATVGYVQTDEQGKYTLPGLDPDQPSQVYARAHGFDDQGDTISFQSGSRQATHDFTLRRSPARSITGRITYPDGSPIKDARVVSIDGNQTSTNNTGSYTFDKAPGYAGVLMARAPGCAPAFDVVPEKTNAKTDLTLQPEHILEGRIVDISGKPIPGVELSVDADCPAMEQLYADTPHNNSLYYGIVDRFSTDKNGYFKAGNMPAGKVYITTFIPPYLRYAQISRMPLPVDTKTNIITLQPQGRFTGKVLNDVDGKPITTFAVSSSHDTTPVLFNSPDGTFTLSDNTQPSGARISVTVNAAGYKQCVLMGIDPSKLQPNQQPTEFRMQPARPLTGRITDSDGNPIEGVQVTVIDASVYGPTFYWMYISGPKGPTKISARTDADGRFSTEPVPFTCATIALVHHGHGTKLLQGHPLSKPLEATMDTAATAIAHAFDTAGSVPKDASISVICTSTREILDTFTPDSQGKATIPDLPTGRYVFTLAYNGHSRSIHEAEIHPGETYTIDWNRPNPVTLKGVFTSKGEPFAHAEVDVVTPEGEVIASTQTDKNGAYSTSVFEPGKYTLRCSKGEWSSPEHAGSYNPIELKTGVNEFNSAISAASVSGTLTDSAGKPLPNTEICAYNTVMDTIWNRPNFYFPQVGPYWFPAKRVKTDSKGRFNIVYMDQGQWILTASVPGADNTKSYLPACTFDLKQDETKVDLVAHVDSSNTGSASVTVTSPSGTLVNDAIGFLLNIRHETGIPYRPSSEPKTGDESYKLKKTASGATVFSNLPAGHYKLFVPATVTGPEQLLAATAEFDIKPGRTTNVQVTAKQGPAVIFCLTPATVERFGIGLALGYKITKTATGELAMEDSYGLKWGGAGEFVPKDSGKPTGPLSPVIIPLQAGEYTIEAVLRYGSNSFFCDDTRANLWSTKTNIKLQPNQDAIIEINLPTP